MTATRRSFLGAAAGILGFALPPTKVPLVPRGDLARLPREVNADDPIAVICLSGILVDDVRENNVARYFPRTGEVEEMTGWAPGREMTLERRRPAKVELLWKAGHGPEGGPGCPWCAPWRQSRP